MTLKKPSWLPESAYPTSRGWAVKNGNTEEILMTVRGLETESAVVEVSKPVEVPVIASLTKITYVRFGLGDFIAGSQKYVKVEFDGDVVVDGVVSINVSVEGKDDMFAFYEPSMSDKNTLTFTFAVPEVGSVLSIKPQTLTGSISASGAVDLSISEEESVVVGTKTSLPEVVESKKVLAPYKPKTKVVAPTLPTPTE